MPSRYHFDQDMSSVKLEEGFASDNRIMLCLAAGAAVLALAMIFFFDPMEAAAPIGLVAVVVPLHFRSQSKRRLAFIGWQMEQQRLAEEAAAERKKRRIDMGFPS
jgi:hypothetical protein